MLLVESGIQVFYLVYIVDVALAHLQHRYYELAFVVGELATGRVAVRPINDLELWNNLLI